MILGTTCCQRSSRGYRCATGEEPHAAGDGTCMFAGWWPALAISASVCHNVCALRCRARLASVCRRWRAISTDSHAAVVWQRLCVRKAPPGLNFTYDSLTRWCEAHACSIRDLQVFVTEPGHITWLDVRPPAVHVGMPCSAFHHLTRLQARSQCSCRSDRMQPVLHAGSTEWRGHTHTAMYHVACHQQPAATAEHFRI